MSFPFSVIDIFKFGISFQKFRCVCARACSFFLKNFLFWNNLKITDKLYELCRELPYTLYLNSSILNIWHLLHFLFLLSSLLPSLTCMSNICIYNICTQYTITYTQLLLNHLRAVCIDHGWLFYFSAEPSCQQQQLSSGQE